MGYYINKEYQDTTFQAHDITWLFRMAQEWIKANPEELIPHVIWAQKIAELPSPDPLIPLAIFVAGIGVHSLSPEIIPALAAVSLKKSSAEVARFLEHHGADYLQMTQIAYELDNLTQDQLSSCCPEDVTNQPLEAYSVARSVIEALASNTTQKGQLIRQAMKYPCTPAIALAKLGDHTPELWPFTHIDDAFRASGYAECDDLSRAVIIDYECIWDALRYVKLPDAFTGDEYIKILDRSGSLHIPANRDKGFHNNLFSRALSDMPSDVMRYNAQRFLDAINTEERPDVIERIANKMLATLKDYCTDGMGWTAKMNGAMDERYDAQKYGHVINSLAVRISVHDLGPSSLEDLQKKALSQDDIFPWTQTKISHLLKGVANDFMSRPLDELEYDDFRIVHRALLISTKQECDEMTRNQLIARMVSGMDSIERRYAQQGPGANKTREKTFRVVEETVRHLIKTISPDTALFNTLSSKSQAILVICGLDMNKFPKMTRADRGRVLESDLGM